MDPDKQTQVRVSSRSTILAEATRMTVLPGEEDRVFVVLELPPPVGTILTLQSGEQARTVEVAHVVEVPDADSGKTRGFYARQASERAMERHGKVGSEALLPSGEQGSEDEEESDGQGDRAPSGYAVPAPVVDPEASSSEDESAQDSMVSGAVNPSPGRNEGGRKKGRRRR